MKSKYVVFALAGIISILAGCASRPLAVSTVGPEPITHDGITANGYLQVFSKIVTAEVGDDIYCYPHVSYDIYDKFGRCVQHVPNQLDSFDESPTLVQIPQGNYNIVTFSEGYGRVTVPAIIEAGRVTIIHLDKGWKPSSDIATNNVVRLPDGAAVGWSSASQLSHSK